MFCSCTTRRGFLAGSVAFGTVGLAGCDEVSLISDSDLAEMGRQSWQQMTAQVAESRNGDLRAVTAEVSTRLLQAAGEVPQDWEIRVFASPEINAFALPGNKVGVYEGMFQVAQTADQLAAIIGHEIGHLQAEHSKKRVSAEIAKDTGLRWLVTALEAGDVQFAEEIGAALGIGVELGLLMPYNRDQEVEADRLGLVTMHAAGFEAAQAVTLWQRMAMANGRRVPDFLSTHPAPRARIEEIRAVLPSLQP